MTTSRCNDRLAPLRFRGATASTLVALATVHAAGCADGARGADASSATSAPSAPSVRVIVGFRPGAGTPDDPAFRERLAARAGVGSIVLIRAMSGDAWVLQFTCSPPVGPTSVPGTPPADACAEALARLRASDAVVFVDVDRRETHQ